MGLSGSLFGGLCLRYLNFMESILFSKEDWKEAEEEEDAAAVELWAGCGVEEGELESEDLRRLSTSVA